MLLDLLQTVGTERCHPPNPDSPSLAPSAASSFLEGQPSSRSSSNSLGKAFPGPPLLSSLLASWCCLRSLLQMGRALGTVLVSGDSVLVQLLQDLLTFLCFSSVCTLNSCTINLFYRPDTMQLCKKEREYSFPHPSGRGVGLSCLHVLYPLGHVRKGRYLLVYLEDLPVSQGNWKRRLFTS